MKAHWQYLKYVLRHKWYVFQGCREYGIAWAGLIHDLSKFLPSEWGPYVEKFYGKKTPATDLMFDRAWNHHQKRNPHHWQYWVLREDSGATKALYIPRRYVLEMVADWRGAGRAITGADNTKSWYLSNRDKIILDPVTRVEVEHLIGLIA